MSSPYRSNALPKGQRWGGTSGVKRYFRCRKVLNTNQEPFGMAIGGLVGSGAFVWFSSGPGAFTFVICVLGFTLAVISWLSWLAR